MGRIFQGDRRKQGNLRNKTVTQRELAGMLRQDQESQMSDQKEAVWENVPCPAHPAPTSWVSLDCEFSPHNTPSFLEGARMALTQF